MKSSLFSILLVLAFLIAASLPAALGAIFVTRSPLAAGQYSITDDIWVSSAPTLSDLSSDETVLYLNSTAAGSGIIEIRTPELDISAGVLELNSPTIKLTCRGIIRINSLRWFNGNISGVAGSTNGSFSATSAFIRPATGAYAQEKVFSILSSVTFSVSGVTRFEGTFTIKVDDDCNLYLGSLVVDLYNGQADNRPSISIRPNSGAGTFSVVISGHVSINLKYSAPYDPDLWIDCGSIAFSGPNVTLPDYSYFRVSTLNPVSWGNPTFFMSRAYARFHLIAPSQNLSAIPVIILNNPVYVPVGDKYSAVLVWGPGRSASAQPELFLDNAPRPSSQIGQVWMMLYSSLTLPSIGIPEFAGMFLLRGSSIFPKVGDTLRAIVVDFVVYGGTASSPVTLRAANLTVNSYLTDQMPGYMQESYLRDAAFNGSDVSRLDLSTGARLVSNPNAVFNFSRPLQLRSASCAAACGFINRGTTLFWQSWAAHSVSSGFDNAGTVQIPPSTIESGSSVVIFTGKNILPEGQRPGGRWTLQHQSTVPNRASVTFNLGAAPYGPDSSAAYDFGTNYAFDYQARCVFSFQNGDFYFHWPTSSLIKYTVWKNASMEVDADSQHTLIGMSGVNFGSRQRNLGAVASASLTISPHQSSSSILLNDATAPPAQFLLKEVIFNNVNITNLRLVPPTRPLALTFSGGSSYVEGAYLSSPAANMSVTLGVASDANVWLTETFANSNFRLENNGTLHFYVSNPQPDTAYKMTLNQPVVQTKFGATLMTLSQALPIGTASFQPAVGQFIFAQNPSSSISGRFGVDTSTLQAGVYSLMRVPAGSTLEQNLDIVSGLSTIGSATTEVHREPEGLYDWIVLNVSNVILPPPLANVAPSVGNAVPSVANASGGGPNGGLIGGIIGGLIGALLVVALIVFLIRRRKDTKKKEEDVEKASTQPKNGNYGPVGPAGAAVRSKGKKDSDDSTSEDTPVQYGAIGSAEPKLDRTVSGIDQSKKLLKQKKEGDWQIPFEDLNFDRELGSGAFGSVWKGLWNGAPVAIKQSLLVSATAAQQADFEHEAKLMTALRPHPNVVQTFGLSVAQDRILLVMEYCARGSLTKYFSKKNSLPVEKKLKIVSDLAKGVSHLHKNQIVHRDLAARNVLVTKDWTGKISDFGMSRLIGKSENKGTTASNIGPVRWMAPEGIKSKEFSTKTDVWSFGITVWEIFTESEPHENLDLLDAAIKIRDEKLTPELNDSIPEPVQELLKKCWNVDPDQRPTFDEIVKNCAALSQNEDSESSESNS